MQCLNVHQVNTRQFQKYLYIKQDGHAFGWREKNNFRGEETAPRVNQCSSQPGANVSGLCLLKHTLRHDTQLTAIVFGPAEVLWLPDRRARRTQRHMQ